MCICICIYIHLGKLQQLTNQKYCCIGIIPLTFTMISGFGRDVRSLCHPDQSIGLVTSSPINPLVWFPKSTRVYQL